MENRAKLNHLFNPHNPRRSTRNSEIKSRDLNSETLYYFCRAPAICSLVPRTDLCNSLSRTRHLEFGRAPDDLRLSPEAPTPCSRRRQLLSISVRSLRQPGLDLVGPDASQGPDGIQDLDLQLSGISTQYPLDHILVTPPGGASQAGLAWETEPGANDYALAEFFPSAVQGSGDLYINPQVKSVAPLAGTGTPVSLGGSTGAPIQLQNGNSLTLTTNYTDGSPRTGGM